MPKSLIFRLMGAFLLVIAVGGAVMFWMISEATQGAFRIYTTRSGQVWAERISPLLAEYYQASGSWDGAAEFMAADLEAKLASAPASGHTPGQGSGKAAGGGGNLSGQRLILVDQKRIALSDTTGELLGQAIPTDLLAAGTPITVDGKVVGTLLVASLDFANPDTPSGQFIITVNQSVLLALVIAGLIALLLGAGLFFQITAPLRKLQIAASAIALGNLSERVTLKSKDEFGDLGRSFNRMAESLDQAQENRRRMMADIAHELRTPLSVIQVNLEGMLDGILPTDREQLEATHMETLLLNRLIGDLRLLSLAEAGELKLELQEAELEPLIRRVVEHFGPQAAQKDVRLTSRVEPDLPPVQMDSDRINQVLSNLISNALRYTPAGGEIVVRVGREHAAAGYLTVSVTDSGPGISAEALPYVFDRFYRADKARDRASGGSGLGLAIVKQLVEAHHGQVEAKSPAYTAANASLCGTQIAFTLPVSN